MDAPRVDAMIPGFRRLLFMGFYHCAGMYSFTLSRVMMRIGR